MSRQSVPLVFIKHPDHVADSYEGTVHQFFGLIMSAEEEDVILRPYSPQKIKRVEQQSPERYGRILLAAENSLSRGYPVPVPQMLDGIHEAEDVTDTPQRLQSFEQAA